MKLRDIFKKRYLISETQLDEIVNIAEEEIEKEAKIQSSILIEEEKSKATKIEREYFELEKKYNELVIKHDILIAKSIGNKNTTKGQYGNLAEEIFKD